METTPRARAIRTTVRVRSEVRVRAPADGVASSDASVTGGTYQGTPGDVFPACAGTLSKEDNGRPAGHHHEDPRVSGQGAVPEVRSSHPEGHPRHHARGGRAGRCH